MCMDTRVYTCMRPVPRPRAIHSEHSRAVHTYEPLPSHSHKHSSLRLSLRTSPSLPPPPTPLSQVRVLPYLVTTFGRESYVYLGYLYGGFPIGTLGLDVLMFLEPFGLLAVLPLPMWLKTFVPSYKATRVICEVFIESLPQTLLQSYILISVMGRVHAGTARPSDTAMLPFASALPQSITISTVRACACKHVACACKSITISTVRACCFHVHASTHMLTRTCLHAHSYRHMLTRTCIHAHAYAHMHTSDPVARERHHFLD